MGKKRWVLGENRPVFLKIEYVFVENKVGFWADRMGLVKTNRN
jgi:hypothetical protein